MNSPVTVHRFEATLFPVNAYLVETSAAVIAVDATLGVSDGRLIRARADSLQKPLAAVLVTHAHPDHYGGIASLAAGLHLPVHAAAGVDRVIRRDDAVKEQILRPMFGDEWAKTRAFPNRTVSHGERVSAGGVQFRLVDVGPGESPHDSWWVLETGDRPQVFVGDLVYNHMHAYLADGFYQQWLVNLERAKRDLPADATFLMGHGDPVSGNAIFDWQAEYIRLFVDTLGSSASARLQGDELTAAVTARMKDYLPSEALLFLMQRSVQPMRDRLAAGQP